ncbi:zinc-binding alcohol dehydrogenase family protein [Dictyobacter arantiisoli]|uniref:Zinc-type alcohol dehydrogenase n=1 Tax=Dictyobacter arantiisoli TaxID=2014874 RepID=A0A5A5TBR5_9CHLR|nr:zinc-binding alcohol dehydrogenase family protein [Dictyobacter arantiisoli]GCF08463.1 zinc-type alcohol dehydrogenase [Dictyobacter arantiisoli]
MTRTIILEAPGQLRLTQTANPPLPGPTEALIRIHSVGVCGTDQHAFHGNQPFFTYPRILGHELGVEVVAVGEQVDTVTVGAHCAVEPYFHCGECPPCKRGKPNCCLNIRVFGVHIDGGMSDYALLPAAYLHPAQTLSYEQLALVEPLAIGAHAVSRAQITAGERVLVIGAGPIGLAVVQFALLAEAKIFVVDISPSRLAFCQSQWPDITCLDGSADPLAALQSIVGDDLPTAVFDATGNPHSMRNAFNYVAYGGRLIFVGLFQGDLSFHDPTFHSHEMTLLSSRNATSADFQRIIHYLEEGRINLDPWITHRATAETVVEEFPGWFDKNSGIIKAVINFA